AAHPRIGDRGATTTDWVRSEQAGADGAAEATLAALAQENRAYEQRFGHVFLISATGKTADEMLGALRGRLTNDPATELRVAAEEHAKITRLRLDRLVASRAGSRLTSWTSRGGGPRRASQSRWRAA